MKPSKGEPDIFGQNQSVQLNWLSMERVDREPGQKWPVEIKHGWPSCGTLYAYEPIVSRRACAPDIGTWKFPISGDRGSRSASRQAEQ